MGIFIVYELSRYLYGWPFYFVLGEDCEALGRFAHPRQIFVMILYSRLLIGGVYNLSLWNDRVAYQVRDGIFRHLFASAHPEPGMMLIWGEAERCCRRS